MTDRSIFILGTLSSTTSHAHLFEFDRDGAFVRKIGSVGQGPGEYYTISNIVVAGDTLKAFDQWNKKMLYYSVHGGEYLGSVSFNDCDQLTFMNTVLGIPGSSDQLVTQDVAFGENPFGVGTWTPGADSVQIIAPSHFSVEGWISYSCGFPTLSAYDDEYALALLPLDNTIYKIRYADLSMTRLATFADNPLPEFEPGMNYEKAQNEAYKANSRWPSSIFTTSDHMIIDRSPSGSYIWDFKQGKGYFSLNGMDTQQKGDFPFLPPFTVGTTPDGGFVCAYPAEQFFEYCEMLEPDARFAPKDVSGIAEDANPILVIFKLK